MSYLVSIICTTYNHENYIADAIESFLMQKVNFNFEILIGEDCSTDDTREIVKAYVKKYPKIIKLVTSKKNVGARKNTIRLRNHSKGRFIAECEGDDYWTDPYKLQKQVDYMLSHPDCSMCFHASEIIQAPNKPTGTLVKPYSKSRNSPIEDIIIKGGGFFSTASIMYPKKLMENPPDFYLQAPIGDYPMQMFLASQGHAYYIDEVMSAYRSGVKGSWTESMSNSINVRENIIKVNKGIIELLGGFNTFTNNHYTNEVEKVILKLRFELFILDKNKNEQKKYEYNKLSILDKWKIRIKIYIRCNFPNYFLKLANYKGVKINKMLKN